MSSPSNALLSVSRLSAGLIGLFYGVVHKGSLESQIAKEHAAHPDHVGASGHPGVAVTGQSLNPHEVTTPGH